MKYGIFFCLFFILASSGNVKAQKSREVDSLRSIVDKYTGSEKIEILRSLSQSYAYINMDTAKIYLDTLATYADETEDLRGQTIAALLRGNFLYDEGNYSQAQRYNTIALERSTTAIDTPVIARAYLNLGSTADAAGLKDSAVVNYIRSVEMFQAVRDSINAAYIYINIGLVFKSIKNYDKALLYYRSAYRDLVMLKDDFGQTTIATNIGSLYLDLDEIDSAEAYAQKGYQGYKDLGYNTYTVYPLEVLAHTSAAKKRYSTSESQYLEALEIATSNQMGEESFTLNKGLADLYLRQGKTNQAIDFAQKSLQKARLTKSIEDLTEANELLYQCFKKTGNTKRALVHSEAFHSYKDSLSNAEKIEMIAEIETKYQTAQKEQEISNQKLQIATKETELNTKRLQVTGLIAGMMILVLFGLVFYNQYRAKQKQQLQAAVLSEKEQGFESVIQATEEERQRISKDLHDGIGQQLSALKMALANVSGKLSDEEQRKDLELITEQFSNSADEVRQISHQMMPRTLMENGLLEAIDELLQSSFQFSTIDYQFEHHQIDGRFSTRIEISLYRVLQELVNNIIKHSEATSVSVQLIKSSDKLLLFVEDNGKGMTTSTSDGHGLLNIRSRLDMVKGSVNYEPSPESGTSATISIPIK